MKIAVILIKCKLDYIIPMIDIKYLDQILTINAIFQAVAVEDEELMNCLNHVNVRKTLSEHSLSLNIITSDYV